MAGRLRTWKFVGLLTVAASCFTPAVQKMAATPTQVNMAAGDSISIPLTNVSLNHKSAPVNRVATAICDSSSSIKVTSVEPGNADIRSRLFGFIPWKTHVHVVPSAKVLVGGQAVGIRLESKGPIVVGFRRLEDGISPSAKARVRIGDMIVSVNHQKVHSAMDLQHALQHANTPVEVTVERNHAAKKLSIACPSGNTGQRELGLYVRDRTVGVGTLTFYDPEHHTFGALGHVITDTDTGQSVEGSGSLYNAVITGLQRGAVGSPGEKKGTFSVNWPRTGFIDRNTPYGVFGTMAHSPNGCKISEPVQIALPEQVHEGPATMYTVLHGQQVQAFDVQIENVAHQTQPTTKSMIVRVTDPRLLQETGGIIQGMSGSPLVQDGRLIGAVTHVFVSDPTRGYGVYAMWMLEQTAEHHSEQANSTWFNHPIEQIKAV